MEQINNFANLIKTIEQEKVIDFIISLLVILLFTLLSSSLSYLIIKIFKPKEKNKEKIKSNPFYLPLKAFMFFAGIYIGIMILSVPEKIMIIWKSIFKIIMICIVAKALANIFDPDFKILTKITKSEKNNGDKTVVNFFGRVIKYLIYIVAAFLVIQELGYDLNGLIAGLGLGGIVVALTAQDIAKSLFGGLAIILDKPFLVGDWIETKDYQGTVEDITFRSTRIRTVDNTLVTIQNSVLSNELVVNWAGLDKRRYAFNIKLPLETNSEMVEMLSKRIKFVLKRNRDIVQDSIEVNFDKFEEDGINIFIYMFTPIINYRDFLKFKQDVNTVVLKVLESENIKLSYPAQNIYLQENVVKKLGK